MVPVGVGSIVRGTALMHDYGRDALVWDAGYLAGHRDGAAGRRNLLAAKYPPEHTATVIDLRMWRVERRHGGRDERRTAGGGALGGD